MTAHASVPPSNWVSHYAELIPASGPIVDLACGAGRHLRDLIRRKQPLIGVDIDISGALDLAQRDIVTLLEIDLEAPRVALPKLECAAIIVTNYLHRPLLPSLPGMLAPHGVLIYETFAQGNERYGRPRNPDFLLRPNELLDSYKNSLQVIGFEQGVFTTPNQTVLQRICAIKLAK